MRIDFEDRSYIETRLSNSPGKIFVIIGSRQEDNKYELVVNSAEITFEQVGMLFSKILEVVE